MAGAWTLDDPKVMSGLLRALADSDILAPTHWAPDERVSLPFSSEEVLRHQAEREAGVAYVERREGALRYEADLGFGRRNVVALRIVPVVAPELWREIFEIAEELCALVRPDYAIVNHGRSFDPWSTKDEMFMTVMSKQGWIAPVDYFSQGPRGLSLRTYFGPRYLAQFPSGLLESTPASHEMTAWGARRLDLGDVPWSLAPEDALPLWKAAWEHIKPAQVTSQVFAFDERFVSFAPGKRCSIPTGPDHSGPRENS